MLYGNVNSSLICEVFIYNVSASHDYINSCENLLDTKKYNKKQSQNSRVM